MTCWLTPKFLLRMYRCFIHVSCIFLILRIGSQFSSDIKADGPLKFVSANIISFRKNWELARQPDADFFCFQETTLNKHGQNSMARTLATAHHTVLFGKPCDYKFSGSQTRISLWNAPSGGLASVSKSSLPMKNNIVSCTFPFEIGRCSHTWFPTGIGRRGYHVFNLYGYVGAGSRNPHAYQPNERLLASIFETAFSLGDVPWIVVGDFQTSPAFTCSR